MSKVVLLGPPGCGKGTQSQILVENFKFFQLSTGDLLREQTSRENSSYGKEIINIMNKGDLVPDEIVINLIIEKISVLEDKSIIFDGFPRNLNQARVLNNSRLTSSIVISI